MNKKTTTCMIKIFKGYFKIVLVISASLIIPLSMYSQENKTMKDRLKTLNKPREHKENFIKYLNSENNEIENTAALLFWTYKNFFSSQDMASCVFTPSCSVYAVESLQNHNPVIAYLKIFDRLARCHPVVAQGEYPFDIKTEKYYDPAY